MRKITLMLLSAATRALRAPISARTLRRLRAAASRSELEALTVPVLKDRLRAQGLKVGGKKNELVERLLESAPAPAALPRRVRPEQCPSYAAAQS